MLFPYMLPSMTIFNGAPTVETDYESIKGGVISGAVFADGLTIAHLFDGCTLN